MRSLLRRSLGAALVSGLLSASALASVHITITNADAPGEGFNDATAATPVGGNTGTTVGQQRMLAFQRAADIWGALLDSPVEIKVHATFDPLTCDTNTGVLGQARPGAVASDAPSAPLPGAWYPGALANKFAGTDVTNGDEIVAQFNSSLGSTGCLDGAGWYYGLDGNQGDQIDLVAVLLHELGHGLGFLTYVNTDTGEEFLGQPDAFESFLLDTTANKHWTEMTDTERAQSTINTGNLVWDGPAANAAVTEFLGGRPELTIDAPPEDQATFDLGTASFGGALTSTPITGSVLYARDAEEPAGNSSHDGCSAITNPAEIAGQIAIVDRGTCLFVEKAQHVQAAGAAALVVIDNVSASQAPGMAGDDPTITIPVVSLTMADGAILTSALSRDPVVSLLANPRHLSGVGAGNRPLLYAPSPFEPGSSVSHWDTSATPNLLMEPNINDDLEHGVDLTLPVLRDIGWRSDTVPATQPRHEPAGAARDRETRSVTDRDP